MDDLPGQISRLEAEIERLSAESERCRKVEALSRIAMIAGALWLLAVLLGMVGAGTAATLIAIAVLLFGTVLYGSNRSSWQRAAERLRMAEVLRNRLIDEAGPRLVEGRPVPRAMTGPEAGGGA